MSGNSSGTRPKACAEHNPLKWYLDTDFDDCLCCFCSEAQLPKWRAEFVLNSIIATVTQGVTLIGSESQGAFLSVSPVLHPCNLDLSHLDICVPLMISLLLEHK